MIHGISRRKDVMEYGVAMKRLFALTVFAFAIVACGTTSAPKESKPEAIVSAAEKPTRLAPRLDHLTRAQFNQLAPEVALPLFWIDDTNRNNAIDPEELKLFWNPWITTMSDWVHETRFTPKFHQAYERLVALSTNDAASAPQRTPEEIRRDLVRKELRQGRQTMLYADFRHASEEERAIVANIVEAARYIEQIHAKQKGVFELASHIPDDDLASRFLFFRNQGPVCVAPQTESELMCSAIPGKAPRTVGLYPLEMQHGKFCDTLLAHKENATLLHQFYVVEKNGNDLKAVPYTEAYREEMTEVSKRLLAAANAIRSDEEAAFKRYLQAAAQAFLDNNWLPADEAWSKMNVHNSKWYLRIAPDEVYFEPCNRKAGFHVSFARINQTSLEWQQKLEPVKQQMEDAIAVAAGRPYNARKVSFHLPDFIDIVLNAGDSRNAHGATIGQSLPNWGAVANEGRGRTVAMTNLYTDEDSKNDGKRVASSLFCAASMKEYTVDSEPQVMSTVLHEAAHNLGPAHEYRVRGKKASEIFGGPMASTLEELKAQTAALFYTGWLADKSVISHEMARKSYVRDIAWAFGHIARGMYDADGKAKPYSQLAAIQLGFLRREGAVTWHADARAANGSDQGCYELHLEQFPAAIQKLMTTVAGIKARGDRQGARKLVESFVDAGGDVASSLILIRDRYLRIPKASFVYAIDL